MSFTTASNKVEIKTSDETNSLNELFNIHSPYRQTPLTERHLPKSFFVQPSHYKGFSSPANLEETYRIGPRNEVIFHTKQRSLDIQSANQFTSEIENISTIDLIKPSSPTVDSKVDLTYEIEKLPPGYELAIDKSCHVYFLNHITKVTTWYDPRLPENIQKWGMTLLELQDLHYSYMRRLSAGHSFAKKQSALVSMVSTSQQYSQIDKSNQFSDKSQKLCSCLVSSPSASVNFTGIDNSTNTLHVNPYQQVGHAQYFANNANYNELCGFYPSCSSIQGTRSHSSNSSCSNISTCLNGLNLSPGVPLTQCQHGCNMIHESNNNDYSHSHNDSLDSGVGHSVVSQCQHIDPNNDMYLQPDDREPNECCFNTDNDEFMDIDIQSIDFQPF